MDTVIELRDITFSFPGSETQILRRVNLEFRAGEFALICGPTGSGKSTLLSAINGLVPHFSSGQLTGKVLIHGDDFSGRKPRAFANIVGYVNQGPDVAFVGHTVAEELAFGMEQLAVEPAAMVDSVNQVAAQFGLTDLLQRPLSELSGGQQQRVAIAASIAAGQKILLLDEPTSSLDPHAAVELLVFLRKLSVEQGLTVLIVEHRVERVLDLADSVTVVSGDGTAVKASREDGLDPVLRNYRMVPPVLELGQKLSWSPLPLSISKAKERWEKDLHKVAPIQETSAGELALRIENVSVKYNDKAVITDTNLSIFSGQVTCLLGPNGSGKTSLLMAVQGAIPSSGSVALVAQRVETRELNPPELIRFLAMVPQTASDLLVLTSVSAELAEADSQANVPAGTTGALFARLAGRIDPRRHPRDLSAGQQLALVLALQLSKGAKVLVLDEPTRGLDYQSKRELSRQLDNLKRQGTAVLIASNDVEFVALVADKVVSIEKGKASEPTSVQVALSNLGQHAPQLLQITQSAIRMEQIEVAD